jgi:hypothetical protein
MAFPAVARVGFGQKDLSCSASSKTLLRFVYFSTTTRGSALSN